MLPILLSKNFLIESLAASKVEFFEYFGPQRFCSTKKIVHQVQFGKVYEYDLTQKLQWSKICLKYLTSLGILGWPVYDYLLYLCIVDCYHLAARLLQLSS